ncbi:uncharacterized protein LOC134188777 isoform X2 [Corticium candelabrum]|nr:uncharacterized protein LOC134188777 isoform X2 [Corticium candelabrum]XP_062512958.1 uncharacterized protein LOC134188777 isoform X2 [Corticium candelabrum]
MGVYVFSNYRSWLLLSTAIYYVFGENVLGGNGSVPSSNIGFNCSSRYHSCWKCNQDPCTRRGDMSENCFWCHNKDFVNSGICLSSVDRVKCPNTNNQWMVNTTQQCLEATDDVSFWQEKSCKYERENSVLTVESLYEFFSFKIVIIPMLLLRDIFGSEIGQHPRRNFSAWVNLCHNVLSRSHGCGIHGKVLALDYRENETLCWFFGHNARDISFPSNPNATEVTMSIGHTPCCTATGERRTIDVALTLHKECGDISVAGQLQPTTNFSILYSCRGTETLLFTVNTCFNVSTNPPKDSSTGINLELVICVSVFGFLTLLFAAIVLMTKIGLLSTTYVWQPPGSVRSDDLNQTNSPSNILPISEGKGSNSGHESENNQLPPDLGGSQETNFASPGGDTVDQNKPPASETTPLLVEYGRENGSGSSGSGSTERTFRGSYHNTGSTEDKESKPAAVGDAVHPDNTFAGRGSATSQPDYIPLHYELRGQLTSPSPECSQSSDE